MASFQTGLYRLMRALNMIQMDLEFIGCWFIIFLWQNTALKAISPHLCDVHDHYAKYSKMYSLKLELFLHFQLCMNVHMYQECYRIRFEGLRTVRYNGETACNFISCYFHWRQWLMTTETLGTKLNIEIKFKMCQNGKCCA